MIEEVVADELVGIAHAVSVVIPAFNEGEHVAAQVIAVRETLARTGATAPRSSWGSGTRSTTGS